MTKFLVLVFCHAIAAQSFSQTYIEIEKFLDDRNYSKAENILKSKISVNPKDDSAHFFIGQLVVRSRNEQKYDDAITHLKTCVELKPNSSAYHLWLGRAYGLKARSAGIISAMGYAGDIKAAFVKAAELDPKSFQAQYDLIQFYLQAPGIAGGSTSKAKMVAKEYEKHDAEMAKLLWVPIHLYEDDLDDAAAKLLSVQKPAERVLLRNYRFALSNLGNKYLEDEQPVKAHEIFKEYATQFPDAAGGYHGMGRSLFEQNRRDDAIAQFEKAMSLNKDIGSQYWLGVIYAEKGERQKAITYLVEFLDVRKGSNDRFLNAAKEKLADLRQQ